MRMKYISEVKRNISIYSSKKSSNIMDGSYMSIYKGRTQNFEDLRNYVIGDNVRDIDWKSSARAQTLLVRQFIAEKKHNVIIVMDTGKKMQADTLTGESKKETALYTAGTIACIANKNGDYVGMSYKHADKIEMFRQHSNLYEVERMLAHYDHDVDEAVNISNMEETCQYLSRKLKHKCIIFLITDLKGMYDLTPQTLKRLTARNDVLAIQILDATMDGDMAFDVEKGMPIPKVFLKNKKLHEYEVGQKNMMQRSSEQKFLQCGIVSETISGKKDISEKIIKLLGKHRYANRC